MNQKAAVETTEHTARQSRKPEIRVPKSEVNPKTGQEHAVTNRRRLRTTPALGLAKPLLVIVILILLVIAAALATALPRWVFPWFKCFFQDETPNSMPVNGGACLVFA
jgi:hypothetical protein